MNDLTIEGVPRSISRTDYVTLIASLGLDPHRVRLLQFSVDGIYTEVVATNEMGLPMIASPNEIAIHRVFIEVKDR